MADKTKTQKFKKWCTDNADTLIVTGTFVTLGALIVAAVTFDIKEQNKQFELETKRVNDYNDWVKDTNNWLNEQQNDNKSVYNLADGRYLVMDRDAERELVIK